MNNYKIIIPKQILVLTMLVCLSILVFTIWTDSSYLIYLIWNIFLAFLPLIISASLLWYKKQKKTYAIFFILGIIIWFVFFPNAPYLITDIIHLGSNSLVPLWFDAFLLISSAWIGTYLGIYSLVNIEQIFLSWFSKKETNIIISIIILLSSFGIYLGRFLRWNSWDLFIEPKHIFIDVLDIFSKPLNHINAYLTTFVFFIFITVSYNFWKYVRK